jgi:LmbE family N-acetylglucosaminyl deacetylase
VHYACATRGEVGQVLPEMLTPFEHLPEDQRLGALREGELRCAAKKLGLTGLHLLGYRDSGMPGSADNGDSRAFINADPDRVTGQLVQLIRSIRPQVVVTSRSVRRLRPPRSHLRSPARRAFMPPAIRIAIEAGPPYQPHKLYWSSIPRRMLRSS